MEQTITASSKNGIRIFHQKWNRNTFYLLPPSNNNNTNTRLESRQTPLSRNTNITSIPCKW